MRRVVGDVYGVCYSRTVWWVLSLKTTKWTVSGFGPPNPGGGSEEERMARGGIEEFASRRSSHMKGAVTVG